MTDYTLYYWPIPFRGHFVRMVLAQVGAHWDEPGQEAIAALRLAADQPYPFMAPPLLVDHATGQSLSQLPAILMALGRRHGLIGDPDETLRLICDAMDVLLEITRCHGAQMWDHAAWADFVGRRLPRWLSLHERIVAGRVEAGFLGGEAPGLADLVLTALWHTMADRLPGMRALMVPHAPTVLALVDRVATTAPIAALIGDWRDRRPLYCAGQIEASILAMLDSGD
ncbi:MAG: glutathione S-transferase family protein [Rhodobacter sp.]|nr:glutathione S-transferase family protein [Paracoccaceae bacterium]MCC0077200.1 glutathione S-transferase family protein [Rhodobacter sp.]